MVEDSHPILAGLNAAQRRAVLHETGSLLVLAGPGSGKTRVIVSRVAYGIAAGRVAAERVLAVTFTSRAADEMKARVAQLVPAEAAPRIGTFHWICHALLRRDVHRLGYRRNFRLLDPSESRRIARQVVREF
ncbi:MAG: UvrD-helicase domain-containing protein, partial [Chloroflexi bacterium]|nr:UvrD-helicase domain-containing protein [Chloroflexota bacterium]